MSLSRLEQQADRCGLTPVCNRLEKAIPSSRLSTSQTQVDNQLTSHIAYSRKSASHAREAVLCTCILGCRRYSCGSPNLRTEPVWEYTSLNTYKTGMSVLVALTLPFGGAVIPKRHSDWRYPYYVWPSDAVCFYNILRSICSFRV